MHREASHHERARLYSDAPRSLAFHAPSPPGEGALRYVTRSARACNRARSSGEVVGGYLTASAIIAAPGMASEMSITSIRNHPEPCQAAQPPPAFHTR